MMKANNKVLLGLSGGVDSTAAALLLKEKGFQVTGYYFDVKGNNKDGRNEAKHIADQLGIELIIEDVSEMFESFVIQNFCSEYQRGRTPNPCIVCNPNIKFRRLAEVADKIGAYHTATGHYARIICEENDTEGEKYYVSCGVNVKKDQSYMMYRLGQDVLKRHIFPLGEFSDKEDIRGLARSNELSNSEKHDSQEICFIDEQDDYKAFIQRRGFTSEPGDFVDKNGVILGRHKGIINYTLGQRKGLGITFGKPTFVTAIDFKKNRVILGDNDDLFSKIVVSEENFFTAYNPGFYNNSKVLAKVRYSAKPALAVLKVDGDKITAIFKEPQRAATPGQSIVFYDGEKVIGGGFISEK